jgi:hypothetical protein
VVGGDCGGTLFNEDEKGDERYRRFGVGGNEWLGAPDFTASRKVRANLQRFYRILLLIA